MVRFLARRARTVLKAISRRVEKEPPPRWDPIWPRIPPLECSASVGKAENYFIHDGYRPRLEPAYFDDTPLKEQWQREVYQFAREVADRHGFRRILDLGCGSGYKLTRYFPEHETLGLDLEPTVQFLRQRYPGRRWGVCDLETPPDFDAELLICADVIEHIPSPEKLARLIQRIRPKLIVISTPERNLLMQGTHDGPPKNPAHVREWSLAEFRAFMESEFRVLAHFISNGAQATQCVLASLKDGEPGALEEAAG